MSEPCHHIVVLRTQRPLARRAEIARSVLQRMVGLLGRSMLEESEALIFPACRSIHTWGMRFPIDVIFVDRAWRVVALRPKLSPGRLVFPVWKAWGVVEMAPGTLEKIPLEVGDQLNLLPN